MGKFQKLQEWFANKEEVMVAFSGGVDSAVLLAVAKQVLGEKVTAVTIDSPLNPAGERQCAEELAKKLGVKHEVIQMNDLENPQVRDNNQKRCYYCKKARFEQLVLQAKKEGVEIVVEGSNVDDLADYRPGLKAVRELGIKSPLQDVGLTKKEIRELAQRLELIVWDKPSEPCLATRIPFNTEITLEKLARIEKAENYLKNEWAISVVRVRDHAGLARIEVADQELTKVMNQRHNISGFLKQLGFSYVTLDMVGYRTGSMNKVEV